MRYITSVLLFALVLWGCGQNTTESAQTVTSEEEKPGDPDKVYKEQGAEIAAQMQMVLASHLKSALDSAGVSHAVTFCNTAAYPLTDSLSEALGVSIQRISHKPRNPKNAASKAEMKYIEDYISKKEQGEGLEPFVVEQQDKHIYYAPIVINAGLCLKCHGVPETDIDIVDFITIRQLYPDDKAHGFALGDVRGMWKIGFDEETPLP